MQHDAVDQEPVRIHKNLPLSPGVSFDPDSVTLLGVYLDELSAFRAKKGWIEALEGNFLLDYNHDFSLRHEAVLHEGRFVVVCSFLTACGRYAFWRLTNSQSPEAQYLIETAHIPNSEACHQQFISAPEMRSSTEESALFHENGPEMPRFQSWVRDFLQRLRGEHDSPQK